VFNAIGHTHSNDKGAHFDDYGVVESIVMTANITGYLGSGSVIRNKQGEYIMNYSEDHSNTLDFNNQTMYFAKSTDLWEWEMVPKNINYSYNDDADNNYENPGRLDCMAYLSTEKDDGSYYGYYTANPSDTAENGGGAGFAISLDESLTNWKALPTPGPRDPNFVGGEVGGIAKLADNEYLMVFSAGHLFTSSSPEGPFVAVDMNVNLMTPEGGANFPRIWGEPYTHKPGLVLLTHHWLSNPGVNAAVYAGLVKKLEKSEVDGVVRAVWYEANDSLKGEEQLNGGCDYVCMRKGVWIEGKGTDGVWIGLDGGGFKVRFDRENGVFQHGYSNSIDGDWTTDPTNTNRGDFIKELSDEDVSWRALVRVSFTNNTLVEFYLNDVVGSPFTITGVASGEFSGDINGGVYGLTLSVDN